MQFWKKWDWKWADVAKGVGLVLVLLVLIAGGKMVFRSAMYGMNPNFSVAPMFYAGDSDASYAYEESAKGYPGFASGGMTTMPTTLSSRNILPVPPIYPYPQSTPGSDAEKFEVKDYNASIETRNIDDTCGEISSWKSRDYVIFENSNQGTRNCNYTFKVEQSHVSEVLEMVKALNPRDLSESTYTIKNQIQDFTSETEILEKKRASIDETLKSALLAYDQITSLAVKTQDADALAKIVDSKIQLIERLTQERISINEQLDRYARAKSDQLDRLDYTYFNISVSENKYIDGQSLKDSWKHAIAQFVRDLNRIVQGLTINLLLVLFMIAQFLVYLFIVLVIAKHAWRFAKKFWKK